MIRAVKRIFGFIGLGIGTVLAVIVTLGILGFGLGLCIESVADLAGATPVVTFMPTGTEQNCDENGCTTLSKGYLLPGHEIAVAPFQTKPVRVREPIIAIFDSDIITSDSDGIWMLITGIIIFPIGIAAGMFFYGVIMEKCGELAYPWY